MFVQRNFKGLKFLSQLIDLYHIQPKYWDSQVWANSACTSDMLNAASDQGLHCCHTSSIVSDMKFKFYNIPPDKREYQENIFLFLHKNIHCGSTYILWRNKKNITLFGWLCWSLTTSTLVGYFVSSPREMEKRDRRDNREDEREGLGSNRNGNESEETKEIKISPLCLTCYKDNRPCPTVSQYQLDAPVTQDTQHLRHTRPPPYWLKISRAMLEEER